ncbi:hypothetical protein LSH36_120g03027, partial [Paralvinella palmiformis]
MKKSSSLTQHDPKKKHCDGNDGDQNCRRLLAAAGLFVDTTEFGVGNTYR